MPPPAPRSNPWPVVAAALIGLGAVVFTVTTQAGGWLVEQLLLTMGVDQPAWTRPLTGLLDALVVGLPAGLLAVLPRAAGVRAAGRAWTLGAAALGALGLLRAIPPARHELYLAALAVVAAGGALAVRRLRGGPAGRGPQSSPEGDEHRAAEPATPALFAFAAGLALLLPWLALGALGGLTETALAVAAAAALGWLAAAILDRPFWAAYDGGSGRPAVRLVLLGGLVAGVALSLVAAGAGQSGAQLPALLVLPATAFAAAALSRGGGPAPVGWLVGPAALGPLAFADPEEISLVLAIGRDVPFWVAVAAAGSLAVALGLALGYAGVFGRRRPAAPRRAVGALTVAAVLAGAAGVYVGAGQPGLHGEKLFVVLKAQADLSGIADLGVGGPPGQVGRDARVAEVYRRLVAHAQRSQAGLRRDLDRWRLDYRPYYLVNAIEVDGGPAVRAWLSRRADVDRVLLSQQLRPLPAAPPTERGGEAGPSAPPWNVTMIRADRVRSELGVDGSGIVVGSSDSGVDGAHPALAAGFRGGDDSWYDPWNGTRTPTDHAGHGTHTLGSAVGAAHVGVAPGARWVGCVNLDRNLGNPARYLDCLQFMLAPFPPGGEAFADGRPERAPHVLTNSWGCPPMEGCDPRALAPATAAFAAAGIFVVAAAGNTGPSCGSVEDPPAIYEDVLTVGAVDARRRVTDFSSRGPTPDGSVKPDLVAPGADVLSAMPGGGYARLDGTSMATPHVAGVVALMWSANPRLIGDLPRTRQLLTGTVTPVTSGQGCGPTGNVDGAGLVDAYAAVRAARG
ncbi:Subtilase family protein [Micromonospora pattaloongensis]|uniref:Subtilase family protein n=2 Tax=Micromonospora pattaloongensis TaxID=405436 RepID=A0A1H3H0D1_9ACTN|nr:S8 family serine peptidase [Micromonospora pattaloongensis]SDY08790.1 Subtilase family protein [Micromonospora pattaloongensis]